MKSRWRYVVYAFGAAGTLVARDSFCSGREIVMRLGARCALVQGRRRHVVDAFLFVFERLGEVVVPLLECGVGSARRHRVDLERRTVRNMNTTSDFTSFRGGKTRWIFKGYVSI